MRNAGYVLIGGCPPAAGAAAAAERKSLTSFYTTSSFKAMCKIHDGRKQLEQYRLVRKDRMNLP